MSRRVVSLPAVTSLVVALAVGVGSASQAGSPTLAVYAAGAEAWAFSVEVGVPGPVGPLASHTVASIDNSPHAVGAAGLADPGYLVRAAAGLMLGVPTPAYCESAHPEGPPEADCGAPSGAGAGQIRTVSGDGPDATSTATVGRIELSGDPDPLLAVETQSATSAAFAGDTGVTSTSVVTLQGVTLAGGAVRIGALEVRRVAEADGTEAGLVSSTEVALSDVTVAGQTVDSGADPVEALTAATRGTFGDTLRIRPLHPSEERTGDGKLTGEAFGIEVRWQPAPDRWARVVLGYVRTMVYAVPTAGPGELGDGIVDVSAGPGADPPTASTIPAPIDAPPPAHPFPAPNGRSRPVLPRPEPAAPDRSPNDRTSAPDEQAPPTGAEVAAPASRAPAPTPDDVGSYQRPPVRWVSPFLVLAQVTTGSQLWWFLAALVPLLLAVCGWRRTASSLPRGR